MVGLAGGATSKRGAAILCCPSWGRHPSLIQLEAIQGEKEAGIIESFAEQERAVGHLRAIVQRTSDRMASLGGLDELVERLKRLDAYYSCQKCFQAAVCKLH